MCTYNGSRYLSAQLDSIRTQTRLPDELVVCDDASKDDTVRIIEQFSATAPFHVRTEVNHRTLGSTKNFEKAIGLCSGTIIALADQDDEWLPTKLETIEEQFNSQPSVGLVFSDADLIDSDSRPLGVRLWPSIGFDEKVQQLMKTDHSLDVLLPGWTVTGATMAFHSQFVPVLLPIPDDLPMIHDGWIAAVLGAVTKVSYIEQPLIKYRQHEQQQIGALKTSLRDQKKGVESFREALNRTNSYSSLILVGNRVRSRLAERCETFDCSVALQKLDARIAHLRTRERLPRAKWRRLPSVFRELFARRYHLYSNGLSSAFKDLILR